MMLFWSFTHRVPMQLNTNILQFFPILILIHFFQVALTHYSINNVPNNANINMDCRDICLNVSDVGDNKGSFGASDDALLNLKTKIYHRMNDKAISLKRFSFLTFQEIPFSNVQMETVVDMNLPLEFVWEKYLSSVAWSRIPKTNGLLDP